MAGAAHSRPVIIQETARIAVPDPTYTSFGWRVGVDGDYAVVYGTKEIPETECCNDDSLTTAFLFRRNGTGWSYVRPLASKLDTNEGDGANSKGLDMRNGVIAVSIQPLHVFERGGADYVERPINSANYWRGDYVLIDGNSQIFFGDGCWGGTMFRRNAAAAWMAEAVLYGDWCGGSDGASGGPVGMSGNSAVVVNPYNEEELPAPALTFFTYNGAWSKVERRVAPAGHEYGDIHMAGNRMFVTDALKHGTWAFLRNENGEWLESEIDRLRSAGDYMSARYTGGNWITSNGDLVLRVMFDWDRQGDVVQVFQPEQYGGYRHAATLVPSSYPYTPGYIGHIAISGRRVLVSGSAGVLSYDLPESLVAPAALQQNFDTTNLSAWTILPGSQFTVAQSGDTRVFRQSSTAGDAGAVLKPGNWTNQSIQAEVKPTAVNGADRWVGIATRRTDASNYYYVTLRSNGTIALKRMVQGQFGNLATATYPFTLGRNYRLRLESIGTQHRVYVDGVKVLEARDSSLRRGYGALLSYRAAADYDNVVVTVADQSTLFQETAAGLPSTPVASPAPWTYAGGQWFDAADGSNRIFRQTSVGGDARAFVGMPTRNRDTIVEVRARLRTFGTRAADPWFGMLIDGGSPTGYVYLSMRRSNLLTLRRLDGTQITQLGAVSQTVTPDRWYKLRLEHVGTKLRAYVDGKLRIETDVGSLGGGQVGLLGYAAATDYDDFVAVRP